MVKPGAAAADPQEGRSAVLSSGWGGASICDPFLRWSFRLLVAALFVPRAVGWSVIKSAGSGACGGPSCASAAHFVVASPVLKARLDHAVELFAGGLAPTVGSRPGTGQDTMRSPSLPCLLWPCPIRVVVGGLYTTESIHSVAVDA
jgi:hypothetical protein